MEEKNPRLGWRQWWGGLTGEQRLAVVVLSLCGLAALALSLTQLASQVRSPFFVPRSLLEKSQEIYTQQLVEQQRAQRLQQNLLNPINPYNQLAGQTAADQLAPAFASPTATTKGFGEPTAAASGTAPTPAPLPPPATMTPKMIRDYLANNGLVAPEKLQVISDAEIVQIYASAYADVLKSQAPPAAATP